MPKCRDCKAEIVWLDGVAYSKHYEPSHWSRMNKGKAKPKPPKLTDEQGDAAEWIAGQYGWHLSQAKEFARRYPRSTRQEILLEAGKAHFQAMEQSGAIQ